MMTTQPQNYEHKNLSKILFVTILIIGILYCVFIPYGAGFDEESHLVRIFDISGLNMVPNRGMENGDYTLSEIFSLSYQRKDFQTPAFDQFSPSKFLVKANWQSMSEGTTRSHYFPANYFLHGLFAGIGWRVFDLPIIPVIIVMKLFAFIFYLGACYLTFRMLPIGKWAFLVFAFTPMALFLTGTLNADVFTLACTFLFIGATFEYYSVRDQDELSKIPWKLVIFTILVGCTKPGTFLVLLLLLILMRRRPKSKRTALILTMAVIISAAISTRWMMFSANDSNFQLWTPNNSVTSQVQVIFTNLPDFLRFYFTGIFNSLKNYFTGVVGVYGYWVGKVPIIVYLLFPIALFSALLSEKKSSLFNKKKGAFIVFVGLICLAEIAAFHFVAFYVPGTSNTDLVGRYFLPFLSLLFIPLVGWVGVNEGLRNKFLTLSMVSIIAILAFYGYGIYRTYYTDCVYAVTKEKPCVLPIYKNVDVINPYIANVSNGVIVQQSFIPKCESIQSVKVLIENINSNSEGKLIMSILGSDHQLINSQDYQLNNFYSRDFLEIPVELENIPSQTDLWIQLKMDSSNKNSTYLSILGRESGEKYSDGELFFNGEMQDADLYFQYTCK